jgi:DNA-directed RNA polymerase subunit N (RpoN/RPB10)
MKINCLSCGFKVVLTNTYDDYEGLVKCFGCGAILEIETQEGHVRTVKLVKAMPSPPVEEVIEIVEVFGQGRG